MNVNIPPLIFYAIGVLFVVFGVARALTLGRRRPSRELAEDTPAAAKNRRYHMRLGILWVFFGVFLLLSTAGVIRFRLPF